MPDTGATCRSCGRRELDVFLSLGKTPIANALLSIDRLGEPEPRFPLDVAFCRSCTLVQILEALPADVIFGRDYPYFSSFSEDLLAHSREHALGLAADRGLGPSSLVVELASNDGYLLRNFVGAGVPVLGIDPAPGPARAAQEAGVPTLVEFFGADVARRLRAQGRRADVIVANNVMAHVPDLNGFVEGISVLLADDGVATIENPYVRDLIDHCEFDTIYHEHYCYFSCTAVDALMRRHDLFLNHVEHFPDLHGGTLRWHVGRREQVSDTAAACLQAERGHGVTSPGYYADFSEQVQRIRTDLVDLLQSLKAQGSSIAAYGAAAKGSTLVNFAGLGRDLLDFVVDRNVHKQGLFMPGVHLPIRDPAALLDEQPDFVLILAWNFKDEIIRQQEEYRRRGGRFIVPIPSPELL